MPTCSVARLTALAVALVHEFQHTELGALLHTVPVYRRQITDRFYAPWRDELRPTCGVFQGLHAFLAVTSFRVAHRAHAEARDATPIEFEPAPPGGGRVESPRTRGNNIPGIGAGARKAHSCSSCVAPRLR
jgi:hypothetical protein